MKEEFPSNTLVSRVFRAARIVGLQSPLPDPAPVEGFWIRHITHYFSTLHSMWQMILHQC